MVSSPQDLLKKREEIESRKKSQSDAERDLALAVLHVIGRPNERTEDQRKVMAGLEDFCAYKRTTSGGDAHSMAIMEGRRQVYLWLLTCLDFNS